MLNIPEKVKERLDGDGTRKNLRLVWENGRADITNENIVSESLNFRESVCSRDSLTFGTAEASTLEFETVGIENLIGCWFSAFIEVDMSDTPGTWESRQDLNYPVYPIPLGRFVVTSCPRNHEAAAHRKFTASSKFDRAGLLLQPSVVQAFSNGLINHSYPAIFQARVSADRFKQSYGILPESELVLDGNERTLKLEDLKSLGPEEYFYFPYRADGTIVRIKFRYAWDVLNDADLKAEVDGKPIDLTDEKASQVAVQIVEKFYNKHSRIVDEKGNPVVKSEFLEVVRNKIAEQFEKERERGVFVTYRMTTYPTTSGSEMKEIKFDLARSGNAAEVSLPPIDITAIASSSAYFADNTRRILCLAATHLQANEPSSDLPSLAVWLASESVMRLRKYKTANSGAVFALTEKISAVKNKSGKYDADLSPLLPQAQNMLLSLAELYGGFIGKDRYGKASLKRLTLEPVTTLRPDQYSSCWFDEYDIEPIGSIRYKFKNDEYVFGFGEGKSTYNIEKTDYLECLPDFKQENVEEFLSQSLVPALTSLSYVPAEIEAVNVPYLEAGDRVSVELADGSEIETYILERNQQGIQFLSDSLTADGITLQELIEQELEEEEV